MRRVLLIAFTLLVSGAALAQGNAVFLTGSGAPAGGCAFVMGYIDNSGNKFYACSNGAWVLVGPGAAGSASWATLTAGTNTGQALVVGNGSTISATGTGAITATAVPWAGVSTTPTTLAGYGITDAVINTRTVNGHALSANVTVTATDVSLGSVTNDAQTKAAIVPNTAPSAGQLLAGNAGGTAYAPVSLSQDCTITSAGVITCTKTNNVAFTAGATTALLGTGTKLATSSATAPASNKCVEFDTSGNLVVAGSNAACGSGGGGAPTTATYITQTPDAGLSAEQALSALSTGILKVTTTTGVLSTAIAADFPTLNQNTTGSAATLTTPRAIYGNNFDGSAALAQIIASTFGGTGNGFTKFSGPATSEKTFTLPNASATILTDNALVTAAQGGTANGFFAVSGPATSTKTFTFPNATATVLTTNAAVTVAQGGTGVATLTGIVKASGTSNFAAAAAADIYALWSGTCNASSFLRGDGACAAPGGSGTVTVVASGSLTSTAIVTGGGTTTLQTPSAAATVDSSGNLAATSVATAGSNGGLDLLEGTGAGLTAAVSHDLLYADSTAHRLQMNNNNGGAVQIVAAGVDINTSDQVTVTHLASALPVNQGGTGLATLTAHALYAGNGTTAPSAVSVPAADSLLYGTTAVDPSFKALPTSGTNGCSGATDMLQWNNSTHAFACGTAGGGGAPTTATYITQTPDAGLSAEQALSALATGILKVTTTTGVLSTAIAADFPTLNQSTTGSAATLTTPRAIYGNNFDGSAALTQIIASTFGGTGNGFTKFSGPAASEKTFTLPNASATVLTDNAVVTIAQGGTGTGSTLTGLMRGSASAMTAAELSGDATTSGSNVVTVAKVNGIAYSATAAAHSVEVITTANTTATAKVLPDCTDTGGNHLNYTQSTDAFSCGTSGSGGGVASISGGTGPISNSTSTGAVTLTYTGTSGGIPYFSSATAMSSSAALTANVLTKGGGAGAAPSNSSITDNGTTVATAEPIVIGTANCTTFGSAGGMCLGEGTAPTNVASTAAVYADGTAHELKAATAGSSTFGILQRTVATVNATSQTASIGTATVCAASAGACNVAGQYRIDYNFWGSGTACSSVTAGKVVATLTWTDENAVSHATIPLPIFFDQKSAASNVTGTFSFNTALGTEGAFGSMVISTNGTVIQYATTYTACTTGTGTYNLRVTATRLQ